MTIFARQQGIAFAPMELRRTITFSVILHMLIIAAAFSLHGRDTADRVPAHSMMVSLFKEIADIATLSSQKIAYFKTAKKKWTEEKNIHQKPPPDKSAEVSVSLQREEANAVISVHSEEEALTTSTRHTATSGESLPAQTTGKGRTEDNSIQVTEVMSGNGRLNSDYGLIRVAIERAKMYPLLARKKKFQGTVLTAFTISNEGHPVNIKIEKSSGYEILDSEAVHTVRRAAPFPLTARRIVIPITFTLAGSTPPD